MELKGKVALVTGAGSGIGRAAAIRLANEGAAILGTDRDRLGLEQTAGDAAKAAAFQLVEADVTSEADWAECVAITERNWGGLDILVAAAGISRATQIEQLDYAEWSEVLSVNLSGVFLAVRNCVPLMEARGGGSIVIVSSASGIKAAPGASAYAASKSGLRGFAKSIAAELGPRGIRVNTIFPGAVRTSMWRSMPFFQELERAQGEEAAWRTIATGTPLGRVASPEEIAEGILYLASKRSSFVTGSEMVMDGGYTA